MEFSPKEELQVSINSILRKMGTAIDRRYLKKAGAIPVPGSEHHLLLVCFHPYHGAKTVDIPVQVSIAPGDPIAEIHLSNQRITEIATESGDRSMEWRLLEILGAEFKKLAVACINGTISRDIKAFYGVNAMGTATRRLGFTLIPLPKGLNRLWLGFWESLLRKIFYSYKKNKKTVLGKTMVPHEIWISRNELIRRYGKTE
jgi:hypothetical protein